MALLELDPQAAEYLVGGDEELTVAVYASPRQSVIAGPPAKIDSLITELHGMDRRHNWSRSTSLSSPHRRSVASRSAHAAGGSGAGVPAIPVITTTSGLQGTPTFDADHWADNLRNPVRFTQAVTDAAQRHGIFIEVSPHPLLKYAIDDTISPAHHHSIPTLQRGADDTLTFHTNLNASHTTHPPQTPHLPSPIRRCRARRGCTPTIGSRRRRGPVGTTATPTHSGSFIALPARRAHRRTQRAPPGASVAVAACEGHQRPGARTARRARIPCRQPDRCALRDVCSGRGARGWVGIRL